MKVLFLDIDGVLNKNNTKETFRFGGENGEDVTSLDPKLLKLFMEWWTEHPDVSIVLSSSWRMFDVSRDVLRNNGIFWVDETPKRGNRGEEIQIVLDKGFISKYAILDDLGPTEFLKKQRRYLVQTSPVHGLEPKKIKKLNQLLE